MVARVRIVAVACLALSVALLAIWVVFARAAFGTWNPFDPPARISYCDRTYLPGSHVTRARIDATGNGFGVFPFRQVSTAADGKPIFAKPIPDKMRTMYPNSAPLPCAMTVYLKTRSDDYVAYGLSGGP